MGDLNRKNKFGKTALHRAVKFGHKSTSAYLMMNNADIFQQDSEGKNFLLDASDLNFVDFLLFTLKKNELKTQKAHAQKFKRRRRLCLAGKVGSKKHRVRRILFRRIKTISSTNSN